MTEENTLVLRYIGGAARVEDVERAASAILDELTNPDSAASGSAVGAGLEPDDLISATVRIERDGMGLTPTALVIVIMAPVATHVLNKFWDDILRPRIDHMLGADALGEREDDEADDEEA